MASASKSEARLEFRLTRQAKGLIERAAFLTGQNVSDFATATLVDQARRVLNEHSLTILSDRDRDLFLRMLDSNKGPNGALKRAARRFRRHYG